MRPIQFNITCGRLNRLISFNRFQLPNYSKMEKKIQEKKNINRKKIDCVVAHIENIPRQEKHRIIAVVEKNAIYLSAAAKTKKIMK